MENYNGYLKSKLGKHRIINWINFINFIKEESDRSIQKLFKEANMYKNKINTKIDVIKNLKYDEYINLDEIVKELEDLGLDKNHDMFQNKYIKNQVNLNNNYLKNKTEVLTKKDSNDINIDKILNSKLGIYNNGNTCFINSILQILIHSNIFIKEFILYKSKYIYNNNTLSYHFYNLLNEINDMINRKEKKINIIKFILFIRNTYSLYIDVMQNDSQEFLRIILEEFNKELNRNNNKTPYKMIFADDNSKLSLQKEFNKLFLEREDSIIIDIFYIEIINLFKCECNHITYSFEKKLDLPQLIPNNLVNAFKISDILDYNFKKEIVQFTKKCNICGFIKNHEKMQKISILPRILILSIQRIDNNTGRKNDCPISIEEKLNIEDYIDEDFIDSSKSIIYKLYGIIIHEGRVNYGHYKSFIRLNSYKWFEFNDDKILECYDDIQDISNAYSLFYIKLD